MTLRTNIDRVIADLERGARAIPSTVREVLLEAAGDAAATLAAASPVDSGRLRDGWDAELTAAGAAVVNPVPYASFLELDVAGAVPVAETEAQIERRVIALLET